VIRKIDRHGPTILGGGAPQGAARAGSTGGCRRRAQVTGAAFSLAQAVGCAPIAPEDKGRDSAPADTAAADSGATTGGGSDCDIDALQRQIDGAEPGATVTACPGLLLGNLVLWQDVRLQGHPEGTTLRASAPGPTVRVISGSATLEGLQIEGGTGVSEQGFSDEDQTVGGGVNAWRSAGLTLRRCGVRDNRAHWGAGVMGSEDGLTILEDSVIEGNLAETMAGGVWMRQGELRGSVIEGNSAPYAGGLALRRRAGSPPVTVALHDTLIQNNDGDGQGGGVLITGDASLTGGRLLGNRSQMGANLHAYTWSGALVDTLLARGEAQVGGGGALVEDSPAGSFVRVQIEDNQSLMPGLEPTGNVAGGLWVSNSALTVDDSVLRGNSANFGGGALMAATAEFAPTARLSLRGSLLDGNAAGDRGGALAIVNGELLVAGGALQGNTAGAGGALHLSGGAAIVLGADFSSGAENSPTDIQVEGMAGIDAPASGSLRCDPSGCVAD